MQLNKSNRIESSRVVANRVSECERIGNAKEVVWNERGGGQEEGTENRKIVDV